MTLVLSLVPGTESSTALGSEYPFHEENVTRRALRSRKGPRLQERLGPAGPPDSSLKNQIPSSAKIQQAIPAQTGAAG